MEQQTATTHPHIGRSAEIPVAPPPPAPALITGEGTLDLLGPTIRRLAIGLLDAPMRVTMVTPPGEDVSNLPSPPMNIFQGPRAIWGRFPSGRIDGLCELIDKCGVNLLHAMDVSALPLTWRLSQELLLPYVLSVHRSDNLAGMKALDEKCFALLADDEHLQQTLSDVPFIDATRVHLLRPGLYPDKSISCFSHGRHSYALIATGEMDHAKPFTTVLKAFAALRESRYDCAFFIIGSGRAEARCRQLARDLTLTECLTFNPRMKPGTMSTIFRDADIVIYPGSGRTRETTVMEAMAAGAAMVVGGQGAGDYLVEGKTATFYDPARPDQLAAKLKTLLDEPELAIRMATNAQEILRKNHSPSAMVRQLVELYRKRPAK